MKTRVDWNLRFVMAGMLVGMAGCGTNSRAPVGTSPSMGAPGRATPVAAGARSVADSPAAALRMHELRKQFLRPSAGLDSGLGAYGKSAIVMTPAIGASAATSFALRAGAVHPQIPPGDRKSATRTATVSLPTRADGRVRLTDDTSHLSVSFALRGASDAKVATTNGTALYAGALAAADVVYRAHPSGTEDYIAYSERPAAEELAYDVDVSHVAGLRLVANTLEFLDAAGTPRLRVAPPYVVDARGKLSDGTLVLEGCAFDANPKAPWGRPVTPPGTSHCGVHVTWSAATYPALVDPNWTATGSLTTARLFHTATSLPSGLILVAGGDDGTGNGLSSAELYDPASGTFAAAASLTAPRFLHTANLLGSGQVLLAGGSDNYVDSVASTELYDPTAGLFTATTPMTTTRADHSATVLSSGQVVVTGGYDNTGNVVSSAELYDPTSATFSVTGSMTSVRYDHTSTLLASGQLLVTGGADNAGNALSSAEVYDPVAATFSATGSMTTSRVLHTATSLGSGVVLIVGGYDTDGNTPAAAELYDPVAATFSATASLATARASFTATLLNSGQVLVAGGYDVDGHTVSNAEVYDPTAATFADGGSLVTGRGNHTANLLASGDVLLAGGGDNNDEALSDAEMFSLVSTDTSSYSVYSSITVSWSGLPGNSTDWISIAPQGSPSYAYTNYVYTGGAASGSYVFPNLNDTGTFVARMYASDSNIVAAESAPFTVTAYPAVTVTTDAASYTGYQDITVSWSGLLGSRYDWVSIAPMGSPATTYTAWSYTGGLATGSYTFPGGLAAGTYVARAYPNNTNNLLDESAPFVVNSYSSSVAISTDASLYSSDQSITVTWSGLPGTSTDWVSIAPEGSSSTTYTQWAWTGSAPSGSQVFTIAVPGNYVARAYPSGTYNLLAESSVFSVTSYGSAVSISTDASTYLAGSTMTVTWAGLPGNQYDWVSIAPQGSPAYSYSEYIYTGGVAGGSYAFGGLLTTGTFVARAYANDTNDVLAESAPFAVTALAATISTDASSYAVGQDITVAWTGLPGNATDWVTLAPQGSDPTAYDTYVYTGGQTSGSYTFSGGLSIAGTFVARAFPDNTYSVAAESSPFTTN
jgi:Kelch motif/Galactose oxidase, central domain